jgi:hypothetical protein
MKFIEKINTTRQSFFNTAKVKKEKLVEKANAKNDALIEKYRSHIREKAIGRVKSRLAIAGKSIPDLDKENLEHLVKEEEEKVISRWKQSGIIAFMAFLGIT